MSISRLIWRLMPIIVLVWATRTGTVEWGKYFKETKGVVQGVATQMELNAIAAMVQLNIQTDGNPPTSRNFSSWLRRNMKSKGKSGDKDHFGKPYRLRETKGGLVLISAGTDGRYGTKDDLEKRINIR